MCPGPHPRSAIGAPIAGLLGEAGQQGPVERLVSQLVAEAGRVLFGDGVVTLADGVMLRHRGSP